MRPGQALPQGSLKSVVPLARKSGKRSKPRALARFSACKEKQTESKNLAKL